GCRLPAHAPRRLPWKQRACQFVPPRPAVPLHRAVRDRLRPVALARSRLVAPGEAWQRHRLGAALLRSAHPCRPAVPAGPRPLLAAVAHVPAQAARARQAVGTDLETTDRRGATMSASEASVPKRPATVRSAP